MAELLRTSPLAPLEASMRQASSGGARLDGVPFLAQVGLRLGAAARAAVEVTLGVALPGPNRVATTPTADVLWLGPDEWLVVGADGTETGLTDALAAAVGSDGAVIDLSGNRTAVLLSGPASGTVLTTCCALDVHPRAFGPGRCASTLLAKAPVIIQQLDLVPTYRILTRPSLVAYVVDWLVEGMRSVSADG